MPISCYVGSLICVTHATIAAQRGYLRPRQLTAGIQVAIIHVSSFLPQRKFFFNIQIFLSLQISQQQQLLSIISLITIMSVMATITIKWNRTATDPHLRLSWAKMNAFIYQRSLFYPPYDINPFFSFFLVYVDQFLSSSSIKLPLETAIKLPLEF